MWFKGGFIVPEGLARYALSRHGIIVPLGKEDRTSAEIDCARHSAHAAFLGRVG